MRLEDMNVLEKANQLEALIAKADLNTEYSIQVKWVENPSATKQAAKILIDNTRLLFQSGRINQLDFDMKASAYANYNTQLDSYLKRFPEFALNDIQTESVPRHM